MLPGPGDPGIAGDPDSSATANADEVVALIGRDFDVLPRSDRMAVCLGVGPDTGPPLAGGQQLSEACVSGTIQLPPSGDPLILLAEHQTTGGYKVPAVVIQADLWQVGQMQPGDRLRFQQATTEEAITALAELRARATMTAPRVVGMDEIDFGALATGVNQLGSGGEWTNAVAVRAHTCGAGGETNPDCLLERDASVAKIAVGGYTLVPRAAAELKDIDLNADAGEGFDDAGLLRYVTSVNIACGGHVGTPESIARTVVLAAAAGAGIGAHVAYPDRPNFGRSKLDLSALELRDQVRLPFRPSFLSPL